MADPANLLNVVKKRSRKPELWAFGAWLQTLRGTMTRERVSQRLADRGVSLGGSTLAQYEKGTVWAPDVGVLLGLAAIYKVPFDRLAAAVHENRQNPTLEVKSLLKRLDLRVGAETAHEEKVQTSRSSVLSNAVQEDRRDDRGETGRRADAPALGATPDRVSESGAQRETDERVRTNYLAKSRTLELLDELDNTGHRIRALASALRSDVTTPSDRATQSESTDSTPRDRGRRTRALR